MANAGKFALVILVVAMTSGIARTQAADNAPKQKTGANANSAPPATHEGWTFAVSGDSRDCGNVIMPAIAAGAEKNKAQFYWHLGDLRNTASIDGDYVHEPEHRNSPPDRAEYNKTEWDDFIQAQINPFGSMPFYVGIGNHETYAPKSREQFIIQFADWLDTPTLRAQRLADNPNDHAPKSFFHWIQGGVDFIYLDNATHDEFGRYQLAWFKAVLSRAAANPEVKSVVVGMHAALPDSLASGHSMSDWEAGVAGGREVYKDLVGFNQDTHKRVYVLSSHSHFFMSGIFGSEYLKAYGTVLPGWIVGTAGAVRYALPSGADKATEAKTKVYGYLLGTVHEDGAIDFKFHEIKRNDVPEAVNQRYTPAYADFCFNENTNFSAATAAASKEPAKGQSEKK